MTAHHLDDQAETVLANLLRGAGPDGLCGIPRRRPLGPGELWRPLLDTDRAALRGYAHSHGLTWIEDPANGEAGWLPFLERRAEAGGPTRAADEHGLNAPRGVSEAGRSR